MKKYIHSEDVLDFYGKLLITIIILFAILLSIKMVNGESYIPTMIFNGTQNNYIDYCKVGDYCLYTDYYIRMKETINYKNILLLLGGLCLSITLTYYSINYGLKKLGIIQ